MTIGNLEPQYRLTTFASTTFVSNFSFLSRCNRARLSTASSRIIATTFPKPRQPLSKPRGTERTCHIQVTYSTAQVLH